MLRHASLALLAQQSYSGPQTLQVAGDVRADITEYTTEVVVACPGTHPSDLQDWIRDVRAFPSYFKKLGFCHSGFGSGGIDLWAKLKDQLPKDKLVTYTGHSLGGALAQVLAALHVAEMKQTCRVVTFGAPRVPFMLNRSFKKRAKMLTDSVGYQRSGDPVPEMPTWPFYYHPIKTKKVGVRVFDPIENHSISRYAADLAALNL